MAITDSEDQLISNSWYAVQVKTTHEKRVVSMLDYSGIESFLPLYETRRPWADRIKKVELRCFRATFSADLVHLAEFPS
jgi:hypothetical protein